MNIYWEIIDEIYIRIGKNLGRNHIKCGVTSRRSSKRSQRNPENSDVESNQKYGTVEKAAK